MLKFGENETVIIKAQAILQGQTSVFIAELTPLYPPNGMRINVGSSSEKQQKMKKLDNEDEITIELENKGKNIRNP